MSVRQPDLDATASELTCLVAVLGFCTCDEAWKGRGLAQQDCHFCAGAADVLDLVRRASKAEARVAELERLCRELEPWEAKILPLKLRERFRAAGRGEPIVSAGAGQGLTQESGEEKANG